MPCARTTHGHTCATKCTSIANGYAWKGWKEGVKIKDVDLRVQTWENVYFRLMYQEKLIQGFV